MALPMPGVSIYAPPNEFTARIVRDVVEWYLQLPDALGTNADAIAERRRILDLFTGRYGDWPLARCRPVMIEELVNSQPGIRSNWTRKRWWGTIRCPFNRAARLGLIDRSPFAGVQIPQGDDGRDMTEDEFRSMLRRACPAFRRVLMFLRRTGARPGELREMVIADVDFANHRVIRSKHKTRRKTRRPRLIYLDAVAERLLRWLIPRAGPSGLLFLNTFGRQWTTDALDKNVRALRQKCGIPTDCKLYSARHAMATGAIVAGVNPAIVAELLGHSGLQTVQRYVHLADKRQHLVDAVEQALRRPT